MGLLDFADAAKACANTVGTQHQRIADWRKWEEFLLRFGVKCDRYLEAFSPLGRHAVLGAFASFVRKALYEGSQGKTVVTGTVKCAIGNVSQGFRTAGFPDPRLDIDGNLCIRLQQIYRGFESADPKRTHQKAIPIKVLQEVLRLAKESGESFSLSIAHLAIGAYLFAMRSCEYTKTCFDEENKRTKILRLRNIRFFIRRQLLPHDDKRIFQADRVTITFEWQKNQERDESVSMHKCKLQSQQEFDPVFIWALIVSRVRKHPGDDSIPDRKVNTVFVNQQVREITSHHIRTKLRSAVAQIGEEKIGFTAEEVGCHSLRSGAAMAMKLAGVSEYTIMIIGRWKSLAFLDYIRKQVAEFSFNVSDRMLEHGNFFTTPNFTHDTHTHTSDTSKIFGGVTDSGVPVSRAGKTEPTHDA